MNRFAVCVADGWSPGIRDPTIMGWLTVCIYVLTSGVALLVVFRKPFPEYTAGRESRFWMVVVLVMIALAINKQLDLQSLLTVTGRCLALAQGWYESRRMVQLGFILILLVTAILVLVILVHYMRASIGRTYLALVGLFLVTTFALVRAAGFHHMDDLIAHQPGSLRIIWLLEMSGPILVISSAALLIAQSRSKTQTQ